MAKEKVSLLEAIQQASEEDLQEIRDRITKLERELQALRQAEKLLDTRLNGKRRRGKQSRSASPAAEAGGGKKSANERLAEEVYDLITEAGPQTTASLAKRFGVSGQKLGLVLRYSGWFQQHPENKTWHIATNGG